MASSSIGNASIIDEVSSARDTIVVLDTVHLNGYVLEMSEIYKSSVRDPYTTSKIRMYKRTLFIPSDSLVFNNNISLETLEGKASFCVAEFETLLQLNYLESKVCGMPFMFDSLFRQNDAFLRDSLVASKVLLKRRGYKRELSLYRVSGYFIRSQCGCAILSKYMNIPEQLYDVNIDLITPYKGN
ncbi:MAG: hypothetical protein H6608_04800 [Flavobacteriales bacterium]|nr:hypothetical protein [Bacteroidota bacterium]MCB9240422.1 hypothetical protein [Flavobacteriales bacterium]